MATETSRTPAVVLTIAGFDPTTGAGLGADLKTLAVHNCYGVAAVSALTLQTTRGVSAVDPVAPKLLRAQIEQILSDFSVAAVKIGMLATRGNVQAVAEVLAGALQKKKLSNIVLDPVLRSTSGADLLDKAGLEALRKHLLPLATIITPNVYEAGVLAAMAVKDTGGMKAAAQRLKEMGAQAVVVTGGDLERPVDLYYDGESFSEFTGDKVHSQNTHGTGCAFSSALAANLANGRQVEDAIVLAKAYVAKAIEKGYALGKGKGLLNHFFRLQDEGVVHSRSVHTPEEGPAHSVSHF